MPLEPNTLAPDFSAPDQNNQVHSLKEYQGQWLLLYFYPKDDTPGCTTEACNFRDTLVELNKYVKIVGVSADSVESHQYFAKKNQLNFPILADPEEEIITAYDTNGLVFNQRVSYLIDPSGLIVKTYPEINVNLHAQEILQDVKAWQEAS